MKRFVKVALWIVALLVVAGGGFYFIRERAEGALSAALLGQVRQVEATRGSLEAVARVVGTLQPLQRADVVARVSGIVHELPVREGDLVEEGQLLLALDPRDLDLDLQRAQATLRAARAELQQLEEGPTPVQVLQARNDVAAAEAEVARLESEVTSARRLVREGALSPLEAQQKENALAAAERTLHLAREHLAQLERGATPHELERARAQVAQAEVGVAQAEESLRRARILAPMDGAVLALNTRLGQPVEAGLVVASLGRTDRLEVVAPVNEMDVASIRIGQPVRIRVDAVGKQDFEGVVTAVAPQGARNQNVATFDVTVALENPDQRLRPGMTATAEIVLEQRHDVVRIPLEAVIKDDTGHDAVVALREGTVEVVPVTLGMQSDREAEVEEGLSGGETLVILPAGLTPDRYAALIQAGQESTARAQESGVSP